jgi:hypothetical protein
MSAAYYLARLGYSVTVFEAMPVPGGMMAIGIPEYRLPREVLRAEIDRIVGLGVELQVDRAMGRDFNLTDLEASGFKAVFLATGASKSRRLGVPGDGLQGVVPATLFLKQVNLGEKPRLAGDVVVVGGGSTAMDAARSAIRSGAATVTVLYRRGRAEMPAQAEEIEAAEREGIVVRDAIAVEAAISDGAAVRAVRAVRQRPSGRVEGGRPGSTSRSRASEREKSGRDGARCSGRGARSLHPAQRGRHRDRADGLGHRGRPGPSPRVASRCLRRWRCRVGRLGRSSMPWARVAEWPARSTNTYRAAATARPRSWPRSAFPGDRSRY